MKSENDEQNAAAVSAAGSEARKLLDSIFNKLNESGAGPDGITGKPPELFPNGVTNINIELSLGGGSAAPVFDVKLQISGSPDQGTSPEPGTDRPVDAVDAQARAAPVRFRIRRHTNATPVLNNARADRILRDGAELLRTVDGSGDVSCSLDLGRDGDVETFSVGNGIINSEADYDAVCGESSHPHRIYIVNQILFCGGDRPSPGFVFIGCADTPGQCMILTRTDDGEEPVLWMHEYGHNQRLNHRDVNFAVMHSTIEANHRRVNAAERAAYEGRARFMEDVQPTTPRPAEPPADVREFVRQKFIHGVPYEQASQYPPSAVPELLEMLTDPGEERYWPNVVATVCMIGDPRAVEPLIRFVQAGEGTLSRYQYDAKTVAIMNLGYLMQKSGVANARQAFDFLSEGLNPEAWAGRVAWMNPYNLDREEQNIQLAKAAVWGLALTGAPDAAEALRSFRQSDVAADSAARTASTQSLAELVDEALRHHGRVNG